MPNDNTPAMPPTDGGQPSSAQGGDVNVTMPKAAFDALHQMVSQLAQGLDALKQDVEKQVGGGAPAAPQGASAPSPNGGSDDEFLKGMAQEGSAR